VGIVNPVDGKRDESGTGRDESGTTAAGDLPKPVGGPHKRCVAERIRDRPKRLVAHGAGEMDFPSIGRSGIMKR
jgi:hypothetical protein